MKCKTLEEFQKNVQVAYEKDIEKMYPYLIDVADVIVQDDEAAKDIVQDAFVRFLEKGGDYDPRKGTTLRTWIAHYVIGDAKNFLKARRRELTRSMSLSDEEDIEQIDALHPGEDPSDLYNTVIDVDAALNKIPPREKEILTLLWDEGLTMEEIARRPRDIRGPVLNKQSIFRLYKQAKLHLRPFLMDYDEGGAEGYTTERASA